MLINLLIQTIEQSEISLCWVNRVWGVSKEKEKEFLNKDLNKDRLIIIL